MQTQLELARDLKLLNAERVKILLGACEEVARMINGLVGVLGEP